MSQARTSRAPGDSRSALLGMLIVLVCLVPRTANAVGVTLISPADGLTLTDPFPELQWEVDPGECSGWFAHAEGDLVEGTPGQLEAAFGGNPIRAPCGHGWLLAGGGVSGSGVLKIRSYLKGPGTFRWRVHWMCMLPLRFTGSRVPGQFAVPAKGPREAFSEDRTFNIGQCTAKFSFMEGDVKINGQPAYDIVMVENQPHRAPKEIHEGDTIETGEHARVEVTFQDHSVVRMTGNARVKLSGKVMCAKAEDRKVSLQLLWGNFWAKFAHLISGDAKFEIHTTNAACGVRGSTVDVSHDGENATLRMRVDDGRGYIRSEDKEVELQAGFCSSAKAGEPPVAPYRCKPFFEWK
jgi:hypothetical protein